MSTPSVDDENAGAALPPMALLATLQTATTVWEGVRERREGRDPAAQEAAGDARAYLDDAAGELTRLHMQLLMAKVQADRASEGNTEGPSDDGSDDEPSRKNSSRRRASAGGSFRICATPPPATVPPKRASRKPSRSFCSACSASPPGRNGRCDALGGGPGATLVL
ncbi:MAG: hypothetical protein BRD29_04420 [Bacteroidetes bacterium QH_2_67_10]|nr:MAG: hypothetical protein BRD29_04420 [Bacteroidetes bacterium QH_2_67_10]